MALSRIARTLAGLVFFVATGVAHSAQAQNWDGAGLLRFGTFLQGSFIDQGVVQTPTAAAVIRQSVSPNAFGFGLSVGYDYRMNNMVLGAEADLSFDDGKAKAGVGNNDQYGVDYLSTIRGRIGFYARPDTLIYGSVGYALLGAEYKLANFGGGGANGTGNKKNAILQGIAYGGGVEYDAYWGIWFMEYLHMELDTWTFRNFNGNQMRIDASSDVVRAGLKFKIGHDHGRGGYDKISGRYDPLK